MVRGLLFGFIVWILVSGGIMVFMHLSGRERLTVVKTGLYGGMTAAITLGILVTMVAFL